MHCANCRSKDNDLQGMAFATDKDVAVMTLCKACRKLPAYQDLVVMDEPARYP